MRSNTKPIKTNSAQLSRTYAIVRDRVVLGTTADLEEFLFGSARGDLSGIRPILIELQDRRCFYCQRDLLRTGDLDHFVPWAQYPMDFGHNFVLAHASCNGAKGSMLAAEEHLGRWAERNRAYAPVIAAACDRTGMVHDLSTSVQIAVWAYEQAAAAGALCGERRVLSFR